MKTTFSTPDIECDGCAQAIQRALTKTPGIAHVQVDVDAKRVTATYGTPASEQAVLAALDKAGFPAQAVAPAG